MVKRAKRTRKRRKRRKQKGGAPCDNSCTNEKVQKMFASISAAIDDYGKEPCTRKASDAETKSSALKSGMSKFKKATQDLKKEVGVASAFSADNLYDSSKGDDDWYGWVGVKSKRPKDNGATYYYKNKDNATVDDENQVHKSQIDEQWENPKEWVKLVKEDGGSYYWCPVSGETVNERPVKGSCKPNASTSETVLAPLEDGPTKKPVKCRFPEGLTEAEKAECAKFDGGRRRRKRRKRRKTKKIRKHLKRRRKTKTRRKTKRRRR